MNSEGLKDLATICSLCNEANIDYRDGVFRAIGEPTEAALKALVEKLGVPAETPSSLDTVVYPQDAYTIAHRCGDHWTSLYDRLAVLEFNRDRKSMSALCRPKPSYGGTESKPVKNRLLVKGAAEVVLARCNRLKLEDGTVIPIDDHLRKEIEKKLSEMASRPHRCLAMAYSDSQHILGDLQSIKTAAQAVESPSLRDSTRFIEFERNMVLVGICGIKDPARPEASEAILTSKKAGIRVMMITGDSKDTAVAIAREVNIFSAEEDVSQSAFTGAEFFDLPQDKHLELLKYGNKVFCRTEPRDKQQLIALLERLGEVTAMTGDGVNDAPALQQADIGIAMGITGTEVAKSAADMVLTDDNFATILNAVEEGRNIYSNMQTFICFLISCNIGEIATVFVASLLGLPEPLNPLHLLWVNLVTDGPPATALGFNPPDPGAMEKPPRSRNESILSKWLLIRYLVTGCYVGLATIGAFFWWYLDKGISFTQLMTWGRCSEWNGFTHSLPMKNACDIFSMRAKPQSLSLSVLVTIEMLKALSAVSLENSLWRVPPWKNRWLLVGVIVPFLMHLLILNVPLLATPFGLSPLSLKEWKVNL
jgi:Ca2+-transporting ATPase